MNESPLGLDSSNSITARVVDTRRLSPKDMEEIKAIDLRVDQPDFQFQLGQSVGVLVPGPHPFGNKEHHRYYSIANSRNGEAGEVEIQLIVRRCFYIDDISGDRYPGIASNYLCDLQTSDEVEITGPYRSAFKIPPDPESNMVMIGAGTGIAPFRAFIQHVYRNHGGWKGKVRLFFGDKTGLDLSYMNQQDKDLANYYTEETFEAYQSIGDRYIASADDALEETLEDHAKEAWEVLREPKTYVFLAGSRKSSDLLDRMLAKYAGSEGGWKELKQQMEAEGRWSELIYF